jgi:TnpA family transposase
MELRAALRAGDVWLEGSRRYTNPETYLIPPERWTELRAEVAEQTASPSDGATRLLAAEVELNERLADLDERLRTDDAVRIENGRPIVTPLHAEVLDDRVARLTRAVADLLPRVELSDLLIEVDGWADFSRHLVHAGGASARSGDHSRHLYAAIMAQATNLGLMAMADVADLSYRKVAWTNDWYLREETLRPSIAAIVDHHYRIPLARAWGDGTLSSSDGQRFAIGVKAANASALPRYFLRRGLTFYSHASDQSSAYGTKVIPATVRDATYVLDAILDNETELPVQEHATDTTGFTEIVFGLFDVLGLTFSPRIRDLGDQVLYRLPGTPTDSAAAGLLRATINRDRIIECWDDLLRVAGSMKLGWVTASLFITRLQSSPRQNALAVALKEHGRLTKTLYALRYYANEDYRRRINRQLNKGESLHALRRFLFFGNEGQLRRRQLEDQTNQASCLTLVTNAVVTWNTIYMAAALEHLASSGEPVIDEDLVHLSPTLHEHINPYGKYRFDVDHGLSRSGLRPLRQPDEWSMP